ncbi:O-antigen ligase family protein [Aureibaculum luteum]|uniref:O-antigen ligase family protein n=1 Tax=Aureibaculum luteum TaxID=1548456 RepID=UPI0013009BBD|nr:O-antigen ligase family protein [Aureibaculum luteum]
MVIFIYVTILIRNPNNIYPICYALIVSSVLFVLSFDSTLGNPLQGRNKGITSNPNLLGMFMLYGIFSITILWNKINYKTKLILAGVFLIALYGIMASASRKSLFSAVIFIALWLTIIFRTEKNLIKTLFTIFSVVLIIYFVYDIYFLDSYMAFRMDYVEQSGEGRFDIASEGWRLFKSSPFFGVGLGTFQDHSQYEKYAHNDFFELIATLGLIGLIIYVLIYAWLINLIRKARKSIKNYNVRYILNVFLYIIVTMIFLGLGRPHFFDIFSMGMFGIMSGYTLGVLLNRNKINEY